MTHKNLTKNQTIILKLIELLGESLEGRKKLMKLMFLIQHYDSSQKKLVKEGFLDNEFIIYHYGVFSFDVMNSYVELINKKIITERPMKIEIKRDLGVEENTLKRIDSILKIFGKYPGFELEKKTLEMLNLDLKSKRLHFGKKVSELIK